MSERYRHETAQILLQTQSVLFNAAEPFTYSSGKKGPVYVDCRRLISYPQARRRIMDMAASIIEEKCPDVEYIAGGETAGIPFAALIAERLDLPMLYVRKKPKGFGRMAQIEGHIHALDSDAILVEDLQTDGGSKKTFVEALRKADMTVSDAFVIFHYNIFDQSKKNMEELGITLHALTDWWAVLDVAKQNKSFDKETLETVERYLRNPKGWRP